MGERRAPIALNAAGAETVLHRGPLPAIREPLAGHDRLRAGRDAVRVERGTARRSTGPTTARTATRSIPCGDPALGGRGAALAELPPCPRRRTRRSTARSCAYYPDTGDAAPGNPAIDSTDPRRRRIVAHGLRNPFRFTFRPGTGEIWSGDVGWNTDEEINRTPDVTQVHNYGWPCYEGATRQGSYDSLNLASCETLYSAGSATTPYYSYKHSEKVVPGESCSTGSSSISGLAFYTADVFPPAYKHALFFSDYSRRCIWVMFRGANGLPDPATRATFLAGAEGPVFLTQGPDGALYYADLVGREDQADRRRQLDAGRAHRRQPDLRHGTVDRRLQRHGLERPRVDSR